MDYKQAYERALESARQGKALEEIFPELNETKDERIWKEILSFLRGESSVAYHCPDSVERQSWVRWLEDHKPAPVDRNTIIKMVENYKNTPEPGSGLPVGCMVRAYRQGLEEMYQLKVEPISTSEDWTEDDERMLENLLDCLRNGWTKLPTDVLMYGSWLKSLKPHRWNESDEVHRQWILECLADGERKSVEHSESYKNAFDWLMRLRPRPIVVEEDLYEHIRNAEACVEEALNDKGNLRQKDKDDRYSQALWDLDQAMKSIEKK